MGFLSDQILVQKIRNGIERAFVDLIRYDSLTDEACGISPASGH